MAYRLSPSTREGVSNSESFRSKNSLPGQLNSTAFALQQPLRSTDSNAESARQKISQEPLRFCLKQGFFIGEVALRAPRPRFHRSISVPNNSDGCNVNGVSNCQTTTKIVQNQPERGKEMQDERNCVPLFLSFFRLGATLFVNRAFK